MEKFAYNPKSSKAEEFISHDEICGALDYADQNKGNLALVRQILDKAKQEKGLTHREASVLLACDNPEIEAEIFALAFRNVYTFGPKITTATALCFLLRSIFPTIV